MYFYTSETDGYKLWERNETKLRLFAYKLLNTKCAPKEEFEDWQSELMVAAWKATTTWDIDGGAAYTTWAYAAMRNKLSDLKKCYLHYQRRKPENLLKNIKNTGKAKPKGE